MNNLVVSIISIMLFNDIMWTKLCRHWIASPTNWTSQASLRSMSPETMIVLVWVSPTDPKKPMGHLCEFKRIYSGVIVAIVYIYIHIHFITTILQKVFYVSLRFLLHFVYLVGLILSNLSHLFLSCLILSYVTVSYLILFYLTLSFLIWSYLILSDRILSYFGFSSIDLFYLSYLSYQSRLSYLSYLSYHYYLSYLSILYPIYLICLIFILSTVSDLSDLFCLSWSILVYSVYLVHLVFLISRSIHLSLLSILGVLFIYVYIYISMYLCIYVSMCLCIDVCIYVSIYLFVCLPIYLSIYLSLGQLVLFFPHAIKDIAWIGNIQRTDRTWLWLDSWHGVGFESVFDPLYVP